MGLIKALTAATGSVFADQWKEFFYADAMSVNTLMTRGYKKISGRSSNTKGSDNIISNGSVIAVADGQCALIVDNGKVAEICAEPGEFIWDSSSEPSLFTGGLGKGIIDTFKSIGKRFTFGGDTGKDQRVYFINTKEIMGNLYGTPAPVPFRVVDNNIGLDVDIAVRCNGEYSYKIVNPILFYQNVCGNAQGDFLRSEIDSQLKSEFLTALQPSFAKISAMGIRYSALPAHTMELATALNDVLSEKWGNIRGIDVVEVGVNSVTASKEDEELIKNLQRQAVYRNANMAGAAMVDAQAEAMKTAAGNKNGAMMGFMGMNMAQMAGGMNAQQLFQMGQQQQQQPAPQPAPTADGSWQCSCGNTCTGAFCNMCGSKKPEVTAGAFCPQCGTKAAPGARFCSACGNKL